MSIRLETARLVIRPFDHRDADAWIAMFSDPEVRRFLPPAPVPTTETFDGEIESRHAMEREIGYAMWAVDDMTTGTFIGQCGLRPAKSMDENAGSEIDLAYHFARASWNKGYATEAAIAVLAYGLGPNRSRQHHGGRRAREHRLVAGHGEGRHALRRPRGLLRARGPKEVRRRAE